MPGLASPHRHRPASLYGDLLGPGARCGPYIVEALLGQGGWSRVYLARHHVLRRAAAIKVLVHDLAADPRAFQRFLWEAQAACRTPHRGVVEVFDVGRLPDGRPFLVMELLAGETLDERLRRTGSLPVATFLPLLDQLADALDAVHAAGLVHRDVKPSNVFLCADEPAGGAPTVKLLDFGIAKLLCPDPADDHLVTTATTRLGTPDAMAPEQIRGAPVDARTDVYGAGVLVYRALSGAWPFCADSDAEIERLHLESTPLPLHTLAPVPAALTAALARALAKSPADRYSRVSDLAAALRAAAG